MPVHRPTGNDPVIETSSPPSGTQPLIGICGDQSCWDENRGSRGETIFHRLTFPHKPRHEKAIYYDRPPRSETVRDCECRLQTAERAQENEITARHDSHLTTLLGTLKCQGSVEQDPSPYCPHGIPVGIRSRGIWLSKSSWSLSHFPFPFPTAPPYYCHLSGQSHAFRSQAERKAQPTKILASDDKEARYLHSPTLHPPLSRQKRCDGYDG